MVLPAPIPEYTVGSVPVLTGTFRARLTGALTDPTTVVVKVRPPDGTVVSYTAVSTPAVVHVSTGVFSLQLPELTRAGDWFYAFEGDGDLVDAVEERFYVRASAFTAPIAPATGAWISGDSLLGDPRMDDALLPPGITPDTCALAATDYLYARSGRRFRVHAEVVRPVRLEGRWPCDCWTSLREWMARTEITLKAPVVPESLVVRINGVVLASSAYRLFDRRVLVRIDGQAWPTCMHLASPLGTDWSIAYSWGQAPSTMGLLACRELAIHYAMAESGKSSKLPGRATSVSRGGVSMNLLRALRRTGVALVDDRTGIALVDDWLDSVNPHNLIGRGSVESPDTIALLGVPD